MTIRPAKLFTDHFGDATCAVVARAPGRVVLMGDGDDFNQGFALTTIINRHVEAVVRQRPDRKIRIAAADLSESVESSLGEPMDFDGPSWFQSVFGVIRTLEQRGLLTSGVDVVFRSNLPSGAGLGWTGALRLAVALALEGVFSLWLKPVEMAKLCQEAGQRVANDRSSLVDLLAIRLGQPGTAMAIDGRTLEARLIPLPFENHRLVILDSAIRSDPSESGADDLRRECGEALDRLQAIEPSLLALRDVNAPFLAANRDRLPSLHFARCRHVVEENLRVAEAAEILPSGDLTAFGKLLEISNCSLRENFDAVPPELEDLIERASQIEGVLGVRMTGNGFDGSTVQLMVSDTVAEFSRHIRPFLDQLQGAEMIVIDSPEKASVVEVIA